jgi:hypothetical protein
MLILTYILQTIFNKLKNKNDIEAGNCISYENDLEIKNNETTNILVTNKEVTMYYYNNNNNNINNYNNNYSNYNNYNRNFISDLREIVIR